MPVAFGTLFYLWMRKRAGHEASAGPAVISGLVAAGASAIFYLVYAALYTSFQYIVVLSIVLSAMIVAYFSAGKGREVLRDLRGATASFAFLLFVSLSALYVAKSADSWYREAEAEAEAEASAKAAALASERLTAELEASRTENHDLIRGAIDLAETARGSGDREAVVEQFRWIEATKARYAGQGVDLQLPADLPEAIDALAAVAAALQAELDAEARARAEAESRERMRVGAVTRITDAATSALAALEDKRYRDAVSALADFDEATKGQPADVLADRQAKAATSEVRSATRTHKSKLDAVRSQIQFEGRCGTGPEALSARGYARAYLKEVAHDPSSVEMIGCSMPTISNRTSCRWKTKCSFRARNGFGALTLQNATFYLEALRLGEDSWAYPVVSHVQ